MVPQRSGDRFVRMPEHAFEAILAGAGEAGPAAVEPRSAGGQPGGRRVTSMTRPGAQSVASKVRISDRTGTLRASGAG